MLLLLNVRGLGLRKQMDRRDNQQAHLQEPELISLICRGSIMEEDLKMFHALNSHLYQYDWNLVD